QHAELPSQARHKRAVGAAHPAAAPALLVLPVLRIADPGFGLDVVEPGVLHPFAIRPNVLAGHRARVTADALVEVEHHHDLSADLHLSPPFPAASARGFASIQSISSNRRTTTVSSRLAPMVP